MKRFTILMLIGAVIALSGCTSGVYKEAVASGNEAINAGKYEEALGYYSEALSEKETEEVSVVLKLLQSMKDAETAFTEKDFEGSLAAYAAIEGAETGEFKIIDKIKADAGKLRLETEEARDAYEALAEALAAGKEKLEAGELEEAVTLLEDIANQDVTDEELAEIVEEAAALAEEAAEKSTNDSIQQQLTTQLEQAESQLEKQEYEKAIILFNGVIAAGSGKTNPDVKAIVDEAERLLQKATDASQKLKEEEKADKEPEEKKQEEKKETEQPDSTSGKVSYEKAKELVLKHLNSDQASLEELNLYLKHDYNNEDGNYVFRLYETVIDDAETGESHMVTFGFYIVDPVTKEVTEKQTIGE